MDIEQQNGAADNPSTASSVPAELSAKGLARRRFGKAGVGVSGVIVTLASQSGMASSICRPPSGCYSAGPQSYHGAGPVSTGHTPETWCSSSNWPSPCAADRLFGADFSCKSSSYRKCTYDNILHSKTSDGKISNTDKTKVARLCAAAMLNVRAGYSTFLTEDIVRTIWNEYDANAYYKPNASQQWNAVSIVSYLTGTMDGAAMNKLSCGF